jgi:hypothetical protein
MERVEAATIGLLAGLHDQVPEKEAGFLTLPGEGDALRRHVTAQRATTHGWLTVSPARRSPLIEDAFRRLEELWPRDEGVANCQVHFGEAAVPPDPDTLILHHGSLRAMVQGSYWDRDRSQEKGERAAQAAWRRMAGTLMGREPGPPTCEKGCIRQSSP